MDTTQRSLGTDIHSRCLVAVHRPSLHLSPLGDLLGALILLTLPSFNPVVVQRLQLGFAAHGLAGECHLVPLKVGVSPTLITLRYDDSPLLRFGLTRDRNQRPELWPLRAELARVRQAFPDLSTVQLEVDDEVELDLLLAVADLCVGAGFPNVVAAPDATSGDETERATETAAW